jgi:acetyltransferase-like isoleucine patch superfamily enzyme
MMEKDEPENGLSTSNAEMSYASSLILKLKRGETPVFRALRSVVYFIFRPAAPRIPAFLKPFCRFLFEFHYGVIVFFRLLVSLFYSHPLFQGRCMSVGKNLGLSGLPFVTGHVKIFIGNDVSIGGNLAVMSGRFLDHPKLQVGDRTEIGWNVAIIVNREVVIEEDVLVANDCRIFDSDGHPREAELRAKKAPVPLKDIRAVRICRYAWIGGGTYIMKGVTIGEGAIIGANSVVISDIPAYCLAIGNPAEVLFKNIGRATTKTPPPAAPTPEPATTAGNMQDDPGRISS